MLSIARHTDYAARIVIHLAALGDDSLVTLRTVAQARAMPLPFVRRLVGRLVKARILVTVRGISGGIRLARPAAEISLLDVVEAMEGSVRLNQCVDNAQACPLAVNCPVHCVWNSLNQRLRQNLASVRFHALARGDGGHVAAHLKASGAAVSRRSAAPRRRADQPSALVPP